MKVLSKTLWAIDLERNHSVSVDKIKEVSKQFGNDIIILNVLPKNLKPETVKNKVIKSVNRDLDEIRNKFPEEVRHKIKLRLEFGDIADEIIRVSYEEDVNVILLNRTKEETMGGYSLKLLRKSQKPLVVLSETKVDRQTHIICPVDFTKESATALKSAVIHAKKIDAKLSIITVYEPINISSPRMMRLGFDQKKENRFHYNNLQTEFNEFLRKYDFTGLDVHTRILTGKPDAEIIKYCKNGGVLYVGKSHKSVLTRAFRGSVSEDVIRAVNCNVIAVKTESVFKLTIPTGLVKVEKYYHRGQELLKLGFIKEAIEQLKTGLKVNDMHLPTLTELARVFEKTGDQVQSSYYGGLAESIRNKIKNRKIEAEIRRQLRTGRTLHSV